MEPQYPNQTVMSCSPAEIYVNEAVTCRVVTHDFLNRVVGGAMVEDFTASSSMAGAPAQSLTVTATEDTSVFKTL